MQKSGSIRINNQWGISYQEKVKDPLRLAFELIGMLDGKVLVLVITAKDKFIKAHRSHNNSVTTPNDMTTLILS